MRLGANIQFLDILIPFEGKIIAVMSDWNEFSIGPHVVVFLSYYTLL